MLGDGSVIHMHTDRAPKESAGVDTGGRVSMTYNAMRDAKRSELIQWRTKETKA